MGAAFPEAASPCGCFPAQTQVDTPHGKRAIVSLKVGDQVEAESLTTGEVAAEPVLAVIDDGIKPLMQVQLSDGSSLSVTTNHPFYVDSGPGIAAPRWVPAGDLRVGDRLRTEDGHDVAITALHYDTGYAHVYTLTIASDHDFFVGSGVPVLVHNCGDGVGDEVAAMADKVQQLVSQAQAEADRARLLSGLPSLDKVAAVDPDGRVTVSMLSKRTAQRLGVRYLVQDALIWAKSIGRRFNEHPRDPSGQPGSYYAGHAEPQMIAWQNQELAGSKIRGFAVSRAPCPESCSRVLPVAAQTGGATYVVAYPGGVILYFPTGEVKPYP